MQQERWLNDLQDVNFERTMAKAPPSPERRMRSPLPQQSSWSAMEEESQRSSVEDERKWCVAFDDVAHRQFGEDTTERIGGAGKALSVKWEGERERANILQRLGVSRAIRHWTGARDSMSVEMCSLSMACERKKLVRSLRGR